MDRVLINSFVRLFLLLIIAAQAGSALAQDSVLAFPAAEGFGRFTSGGRSGDIYEVTNLNNSGPGSFRDAVEQEGARNVIFRISGTILLTSDLRIRNDSISIFGQTAPGDGIAISGRSTVIDASNVIIQHMRFRPGDIGTGDLDGLDALWGRNNSDIIIDHCSMSWSVDETGSFYDNSNFTLQWSILSESMFRSVHGKGDHGYGGIWGGEGATFHHNLLAHHTSRNPRFQGARYNSTPQTEKADYRNNVIYNWAGNSAYGGENGNYNMVANYYKAGPATPDNDKRYRILDAEGDGQWYIEDNFVDGFPEVSENNWVSVLEDGIQAIQGVHPDNFDDFRAYEPIEVPELPSFETAEEAFLSVLENAGAVLPRRDTVDARIVHETRTGTATYGGSYGEGTGIIDSQEDVGGWPELLSSPAPDDSDHDGIPDSWETENGLDPNNYEDGKLINSSGYSNFESYIHTLDSTAVEFVPVPGTLDLIYPVSESEVEVRPELSWSDALFAEQFEFEIRDGAGDFANVILDSVLVDTVFIYPEELAELEGNTTYFWRARALNEAGEGPWSPFEYFVTKTTTSNESGNAVPGELSLSQNYPNPFNPSTTIHFALPQAAVVELSVYDMAGRKVLTLVSEVKKAGNHSVDLNATELSSGVYFYRLTGKSVDSRENVFLQTRKMTLIK